MVQYLVTYSIQTGKERQHEEWWQKVGKGFWQKQGGFSSLRRYSTLLGAGPDIVLEIDFASGKDVIAALEGQEARDILEEFEHLLEHLSTKIIISMG